MKKCEKFTLALRPILILTILAFLSVGCKKSEVETPNPETVLFSDSSSEKLAATAPTKIPSGSYDLTKSLPSGYKKDGTVDYTSYLQKAISANKNVTFPAFPIMVNATGLIIPSDRVLNFLLGSKLLLKPTSSGNYNMIRIDRVSNVTLNNPVLVGDVGKHLGSSGEWGMGIAIYSSNNITVNDANVTKCWGDGLYLSSSNGKGPSTNVKISNAVLQYNRRDGMSIITVNGLVLESVTAGNSGPASPMSGINFEPERPSDELQNIKLIDCKTEYNAGSGIQIGFSNLYGGSNKTIGITIDNHYDKRSKNGVKVGASISKKRGSEIISGTLRFNSPYWRENTGTSITTNIFDKTLKLVISNPSVSDVNGNLLSDSEVLTHLTYKTRINREAAYSILF